MLKILCLGLSISLLFSSTSFGSESVQCGALLKAEPGEKVSEVKPETQVLIKEAAKLKGPVTIYNLSLKLDTRFSQQVVTKESYVDLFRMLGRTQFEILNEKNVEEKGTLLLGQDIDDAISIQNEYVHDKVHQKFVLIKISILNRNNGQVQTLTKEPLDFSGTNLTKSEIPVAFESATAQGKVLSNSDIKIAKTAEVPEGYKAFSLAEAKISEQTVSIPSTISGDAYLKLKKWYMVAEHLSHSEINIVDTIHKKNWAIAKGQFRRFMEFAQDRFFKQAVGLLIVYCVFDGVGNFAHDVARYAVAIMQSQQATISLKVKETTVDGNTINKEEKFKITLPEKQKTNGAKK